jgi:hypothetical protein
MKQTSNINHLTGFMFRIHQIQIQQFILDNSEAHKSVKSNHPYTFEINAGGLIDPQMKIIGVEFNTKIFTDTIKTDKVCELTVLMSFYVKNFEEVVTCVENEYDIPEQLMHHLIALTLATTRGILFEKLQGSFLSHIILPIFDVPGLRKIKRNKS